MDHLSVTNPYKPGDPCPEGYMAFHAWSEIQHKAGLRQRLCQCNKWRYPQEECCVPHEERTTNKAWRAMVRAAERKHPTDPTPREAEYLRAALEEPKP